MREYDSRTQHASKALMGCAQGGQKTEEGKRMGSDVLCRKAATVYDSRGLFTRKKRHNCFSFSLQKSTVERNLVCVREFKVATSKRVWFCVFSEGFPSMQYPSSLSMHKLSSPWMHITGWYNLNVIIGCCGCGGKTSIKKFLKQEICRPLFAHYMKM